MLHQQSMSKSNAIYVPTEKIYAFIYHLYSDSWAGVDSLAMSFTVNATTREDADRAANKYFQRLLKLEKYQQYKTGHNWTKCLFAERKLEPSFNAINRSPAYESR